MSFLYVLLYVIISSFSLILVKHSTYNKQPIVSVNEGVFRLNLSVALVVGIIMYLISFIIYIYLISKNDLGYIVPILTGLVYVIVFFASYFVFSELFSPIKIVGIFIIIVGVVILGLNR